MTTAVAPVAHPTKEDPAKLLAGAPPRTRLFVYGTLRPTLYPEQAKRFGLTLVAAHATLHGHWKMHDLGRFPALVQTEPNGHPDDGAIIVGEVVEISSLAQADYYEGYPRMYTRSEVDVTIENGQQLRCWVYHYAAPQNIRFHPVVPGGDWGQLPNIRA